MKTLPLLLSLALSASAQTAYWAPNGVPGESVLYVVAANANTNNWRAFGFRGSITNDVAEAPSSYLLSENFETATTGFENEGWTTENAVEPAYVDSALEGYQYCRLSATGEAVVYDFGEALTNSTVYMYFMCYLVPADGAVLEFLDASSNVVAYARLTVGGEFRLYDSALVGAWSTPLTANIYYVWIDYTPGAGDTGAFQLGVTTLGTKPTMEPISPATMTAFRYLRWVRTGNGLQAVDRIRVKATAMETPE